MDVIQIARSLTFFGNLPGFLKIPVGAPIKYVEGNCSDICTVDMAERGNQSPA